MTFDDLAVAASASAADAIKYVDHLNVAMERFEIDRSQRRKAMFIAHVAVESSYLKDIEESLYYKDAQRIAKMYDRVFNGNAAKAAPYVRNHSGLSKLLYQGFHGRGLIQLTWRENYEAASDYFGIDFTADPDLLLRPDYAALTAGWYFAVFRPCLDLADQGDVPGVTRLINGKRMMHLAERQAQYNIALQVAL